MPDGSKGAGGTETAARSMAHSAWLKVQQDNAADRLGYIPLETAAAEAERQKQALEQGSPLTVEAATLYVPRVHSSDHGQTRYPWSLTVAQRAMSAVGYTPSWSRSDSSRSARPWSLDLQDKGMEAIGYVRRDRAAKYAGDAQD